jgi:hypothetical protein
MRLVGTGSGKLGPRSPRGSRGRHRRSGGRTADSYLSHRPPARPEWSKFYNAALRQHPLNIFIAGRVYRDQQRPAKGKGVPPVVKEVSEGHTSLRPVPGHSTFVSTV